MHFQSLDIKYLTLHSLDEVLVLFTDEKEEEQEEEDDEEEDSYFGKWTQEWQKCDQKEEWEQELISAHFCLHPSSGKLDDEIAASVFENRVTLLDMDSVTQLT